MTKISVIIPYFQRQPGILRRALESVLAQKLPNNWQVEVIVVDDGSPHPAREDITGLAFNYPFSLNLIEQVNGGVAAARNRGLDAVALATTLVAFLDSDDSWPSQHLAKAIEATDKGYDFVFCDNRRADSHESYITDTDNPQTHEAISQGIEDNGLTEINRDDVTSLIIEEFPTQASSVVFRWAIAADLRFDRSLASAGEDLLYMVSLIARVRRVAFNTSSFIECGRGVNIFFGNFDWNSSKFMSIKHDQVRCHEIISHLPGLSDKDKSSNAGLLKKHRANFVFHSLRYIMKNKGKIPPQIVSLAKSDPGFVVWFPLYLGYVLLGYPLGFYRPV